MPTNPPADDLSKTLIAIARASHDATVARHAYRRSPGECRYCDEHRYDSMMPSHTALARCESGKHPHCTCDTCF